MNTKVYLKLAVAIVVFSFGLVSSADKVEDWFNMVRHESLLDKPSVKEFLKNQQERSRAIKQQGIVKYQEKAPVLQSTQEEAREFLYTPVYTIKADIKDQRGNVVHKRGSKVNLLAYSGIGGDILLINESDPRQVKWRDAWVDNYTYGRPTWDSIFMRINKDKEGLPVLIFLKDQNDQPLQEWQVYRNLETYRFNFSESKLNANEALGLKRYFGELGLITLNLGIKHLPVVISQDGTRLRIKEIALQKDQEISLDMSSTVQLRREFYYDPTYTLKESIKDYDGNVVYRKGSTMNPLEHHTFIKNVLIIDSEDRDQVVWSWKAHPHFIVKYLYGTKQSFRDNNTINMDVHLPSIFPKVKWKLGIKSLPAIVSQEGKKLKIREIKLRD